MATQYGEDIAVLKDQMKDVKETLVRIETKLDSGAATYATKQELKSFKWVTVPTVILLTAVITGLVIYYLSGRHSVVDPTAGTTTGASSTTSTATSHSDTTTPSDSQTSNGGVTVTVPKVTP